MIWCAPRKHVTSAYRDLLLLKEEEKKHSNPQIKEEGHEISADDKHKFNNLQYKRAADVMNEVRFRNKNTVKHSVEFYLTQQEWIIILDEYQPCYNYCLVVLYALCAY